MLVLCFAKRKQQPSRIGEVLTPYDDHLQCVDDFTTANSVDVPFRPGAPGVIDLTRLRERLVNKAPNVGATLEPHEFALQMLRFPFRQVFGDPDDLEDIKFYDLDGFKVQLAIEPWTATVATHLQEVQP